MSLTLAQLGFVHEYGTTRAGRNRNVVIPARPFLIPGIQEGRAELSAMSRDLLLKVMHGEMSKRAALGKLGGRGQELVQRKIRSIWSPELAESTKAAKGSSKPLIDIGNMIQNVQWEYDE